METGIEIPEWAGKPNPGLHLDVKKDGKFLQKLMIDEKRCYFFGRSADINDYILEHASCSRIHAILTYHKSLNLSYLTDNGSTHGTFVGNMRLDQYKPTVIPIGTSFRFGASTREYTLKDNMESDEEDDGKDNSDSLTDYNTACNRKIIVNDTAPNKKTNKRKIVQFNGDADAPEETVRNTTVPAKKMCIEPAVYNAAFSKSIKGIKRTQLIPAPESDDVTMSSSSNKTYAKERWPK